MLFCAKLLLLECHVIFTRSIDVSAQRAVEFMRDKKSCHDEADHHADNAESET